MLCWEWNSLQSPRWLWLPADITHMIKFSCNNNACAQWQTCYYGSWTTLLNFRLLGAFSFTRKLLLKVEYFWLDLVRYQCRILQKERLSSELWLLWVRYDTRYTSALCFCSILLFCCLPVKNGNFLSVFALTLQGFCFVCYSKRCTKTPGQSNNYFFFDG